MGNTQIKCFQCEKLKLNYEIRQIGIDNNCYNIKQSRYCVINIYKYKCSNNHFFYKPII